MAVGSQGHGNGGSVAHGGGSASAWLFREGEYWALVRGESVLRLRDSKGLRYLAVLVAHPGQELHAIDLVAAGEQGGPVADRPTDTGAA